MPEPTILINHESNFVGRPRVVIITGPGFQDHDNIASGYGFRGACFQVDFATADGEPVFGKFGTRVPLDKRSKACISFDELDVDRHDIAILTGGHEAPDRVRQDQRVKDFVHAMDAAGKVVGAICHGPWVAISARIVKGRHVAAYPGLRDDLESAGAVIVEGADVVVDGNLVTGSYYGEIGLFLRTVIELAEQRHGDDTAA